MQNSALPRSYDPCPMWKAVLEVKSRMFENKDKVHWAGHHMSMQDATKRNVLEIVSFFLHEMGKVPNTYQLDSGRTMLAHLPN